MFIIAVACTQKKQPVIIPGEDITALRKQIAAREQKINDTALAKDTIVLLELYKQQADDSRRVGDWAQFASYYFNRYELAGSAGNFHALAIPCLDSIITYEDTLAKTDSLKRPLMLAYFNRLYDLTGRDNIKVAADFEKFQLYADLQKDSEFFASARISAGIAWTMIGDNQVAASIFEKALQQAKKENDIENTAWITINLANCYRNDGQPAKAVQIVLPLLNMKNISPERRAYLHAVLAETYNEQGRMNEAAEQVRLALPLLNSLPGRNDDINTRLFNIYRVQADVFEQQQQLPAAVQSNFQALKYFAAVDSTFTGRDVAKTFKDIGKLYLLSGQPDTAFVYLNKAIKALFPSNSKTGLDHLPADSQLTHENTIMEVMDAASEAYLQQYKQSLDVGSLQRSLNCINIAFKTEELIRQVYIYDDSKYRQGKESKARSEHGIMISRLLWGATGNDKWLDEAFMYAERSRANVLMDKIKENLLSGFSSDSSFAETKQLWFKIQSINDEINRLKQDTANAAIIQALTKEKEQFDARFSSNRSRANTLLQNVYKNNSIYTTTTGIRQKLLQNNDAIIEYFAGDSLLYRFVLQKGKENVEVAAVPLSAADTLVQALLPYLTGKDKYNNDPAAYAQLAAALYRQIFPVLPATAKKIMIIADGLLQFLPFEALMADAGKPGFLVQQFQFTSAFSCASLLQQMNMAGGIFDADGIAFAPFTSKGKDSLPALPQSGAEAESLRKAGDVVSVFKNENATSKRFIELAGKGKILHLASHAFADGSDSIQPRIEFADGSLSLEKIYALQLSNRLVVLSACQTGIGKLVTAEGALSLARGFYYSGAKNVINSLWEVDDQSAGLIFGKFYRHLKKTGSIGQSLALARQEYIQEAPVEKRSPYYWASFVCIGDGVYEEPKDNTRFLLICVGGLLGLAVLMIVFRNRR